MTRMDAYNQHLQFHFPAQEKRYTFVHINIRLKEPILSAESPDISTDSCAHCGIHSWVNQTSIASASNSSIASRDCILALSLVEPMLPLRCISCCRCGNWAGQLWQLYHLQMIYLEHSREICYSYNYNES